MNEFDRVYAETKDEFPEFRIIPKKGSTLMKVIAFFLFFNKSFMTGYATTIGYTVYVTDSWVGNTLSEAALLRHERVHMRQCRKFSLPIYGLLYLLVLPCVWTFRAKFEMEAYEESIRAWLEYHGESTFTLRRKDHIVQQFTTGAYGWMCPFPERVSRWYDEALERAKSERS